jgi:hypothetical protein
MNLNFGTKHDCPTSAIDFQEIFSIDKSIRFVGRCSKQGKVLAVKYRNEIIPLMPDKELLYSIIKSVERMNTRRDSEEHLGPPLYSITAYGNVKRATIPIKNDIFFVSFERYGDEHKILSKILKHVEKYNN